MIARVCSLAVALCLMAGSLPAMTTATEHPGSVVILLGVEKVRSELKLNSLQRAILDSMRGEYKLAARKLTDPMPTTPADRAEAEKKLLQLNARYNDRAMSVLNDSQRGEFLQIERKVLGSLALYTPSLQKKIGLSGDQKEAIEKIRLQGVLSVAKINRKFEEGKIGYQERLELLRTRKLAQGAELLKVLTPEQRTVFLAQTGKTAAL